MEDKMVTNTLERRPSGGTTSLGCDRPIETQAQIYAANCLRKSKSSPNELRRRPEGSGTRMTTPTTTPNRRREVNLISLASFAFLIKCALILTLTRPMETIAQSESTIRINRFQVPTQTQVGELRRIYCSYELQGAVLHALKLFKDENEFYRFTPRDKKMTFPVPGVQVDLNRSNEREIWLRINKQSAGRYKCQVSIEGTFNSVTQEKQMEVFGQHNSLQPRPSQAGLRPTKTANHSASNPNAVRMQTLTIQNGTRASSSHSNSNNNLNQHFIPSLSQFLPSSSSSASSSSAATWSIHPPTTTTLLLAAGLSIATLIMISITPNQYADISPTVKVSQVSFC